MITEQDLLDHGYKRYKNPLNHGAVDHWFFQKRFTDDVGTRYFIDVYQYDWKHVSHGVRQDISYEARVNFYDADGMSILQCTIMDDGARESVEALEQFVDSLYHNGLPVRGYYAKWE